MFGGGTFGTLGPDSPCTDPGHTNRPVKRAADEKWATLPSAVSN